MKVCVCVYVCVRVCVCVCERETERRERVSLWEIVCFHLRTPGDVFSFSRHLEFLATKKLLPHKSIPLKTQT